MKKQIKILNQSIDYTIKTSRRAKRMRLAIYNDGSLVVTKPYGWPNFLVNFLLRNKASWILSKAEYLKEFKRTKIVKNNKQHFLQYKGTARNFIEDKVKELNQHYKFNYNRISIRNQTTRWGSCSQNGNLNFNYKLLFLPKKVAEYVIIHEICHLKEMNHSPRFWGLVALTVPGYQEIRRELRKKMILK